jgi:hypothetical protein
MYRVSRKPAAVKMFLKKKAKPLPQLTAALTPCLNSKGKAGQPTAMSSGYTLVSTVSSTMSYLMYLGPLKK